MILKQLLLGTLAWVAVCATLAYWCAGNEDRVVLAVGVGLPVGLFVPVPD